MTASTSGRMSEPPSTVMVPWPLMTVETPNSSKTLPDSPKPEILPPAAPDDEPARSFLAFDIVPAITPRLPRNDRRVHVRFMAIISLPFPLNFGLLPRFSLFQPKNWPGGRLPLRLVGRDHHGESTF